MDGTRLQAVLDRGRSIAAAHIGVVYSGYRPTDANAPLAASACYGQLPAAFNARDLKFRRPADNEHDVWWGVFDTSVTKTGDYLVGEAGTFFIAAQQALLPPVCILANRLLSLSRPAAAARLGVNGYGGVTRAQQVGLLTGWPVSIANATNAAPGLPGEQRLAAWTLRLPMLPVIPHVGDVADDDLGQTYVVVAAEQTDLGWQLAARQMT